MQHPTSPGTPSIEIVRAAPHGLPEQGDQRLGVLGGAYNPITRAHLAIADAVVHTMGMHEVLFCLPQVPPHKSIFGASLVQRLEMMQLAVADCPYAAVGLSSHGLFLDIYTALRTVYPPSTEVFFVTGRDAAERILTWEYDDAAAALRQMFTAFQLIVCDRDGAFQLPDDPLLTPYHDRIHRCPLALDAISSTVVREHLQQGRAIDAFVPPAVAAYIQQHGLYRDFQE
jgi:nicotinate-nucleotide adenylyltransferase